MFVVTTNYPGSGPTVDSSWTLTLSAVDSVRRIQATERRVGLHARTHLEFEGRAVSASTGQRAQPAEIDSSVLYIGCRDCTDASPLVLRVRALSASGFWGSWRDYQTGIGYVVDGKGKRAPDPAGHFCAIRVRGSG
jgi:hypothetical protein